MQVIGVRAAAEATSIDTLAEKKDAATLEASLLYVVGDLRQLARSAPPHKTEAIEAVADLLAGLARAKD